MEDKKSNIKLGAQNCFYELKGAYTGAVSAPMLKSVGCDYALVGHSERRKIFSERDSDINHALERVQESGITPILCIGETKEEVIPFRVFPQFYLAFFPDFIFFDFIFPSLLFLIPIIHIIIFMPFFLLSLLLSFSFIYFIFFHFLFLFHFKFTFTSFFYPIFVFSTNLALTRRSVRYSYAKIWRGWLLFKLAKS